MTPYTDADGRRWHEYEVQFTSPDGTFGFRIAALSEEHARLLLDDIKATAAVRGRVYKVEKT